MNNTQITLHFILVTLAHIALTTITIITTSHQNYKERIILTYICLLSTITFYKTWKLNPKIFNEKSLREPQALVLGKSTIVNTYINAKQLFREIATKDGVFVERFCVDCNLFRNRFITHCRYCDSCIFMRDHHCAWLGTCVAHHNIQYFLLTIFSVLVMCIYNSLKLEFSNLIARIALKIVFAGASLVFGIMCAYYLFLLFINKTSAEFLKQEGDPCSIKKLFKIIDVNKTHVSEYQC